MRAALVMTAVMINRTSRPLTHQDRLPLPIGQRSLRSLDPAAAMLFATEEEEAAAAREEAEKEVAEVIGQVEEEVVPAAAIGRLDHVGP